MVYFLAMTSDISLCWICGSNLIQKIKQKYVIEVLNPEDLKITDTSYGSSLPRFKCLSCNFVFCPDAANFKDPYIEMFDDEYLQNKLSRVIFSENLVERIDPFIKGGHKSWLDFGAGAGNLAICARALGYEVSCVEQSNFFRSEIQKLGIEVFSELPDKQFDVITLIDVIEHVSNPILLIDNLLNRLKSGGLMCIVTPNRNSFVALLLRSRWWHIRPAHIGYFAKVDLLRILRDRNMKKRDVFNPNWYFPYSEIQKKISEYFPFLLKINLPNSDKIFTINFRDSIGLIFEKD
jgi:2-polyprenyl-3-methyl-5-hydroxy-6-metoxy-1,4-benzoquinol methylase